MREIFIKSDGRKKKLSKPSQHNGRIGDGTGMDRGRDTE